MTLPALDQYLLGSKAKLRVTRCQDVSFISLIYPTKLDIKRRHFQGFTSIVASTGFQDTFLFICSKLMFGR